jgi:hypothetical protein
MSATGGTDRHFTIGNEPRVASVDFHIVPAIGVFSIQGVGICQIIVNVD